MAETMRFKLLRGMHSHGGKNYGPGSIVESTINLEERMGAEKFQQVGDKTKLKRVDPRVAEEEAKKAAAAKKDAILTEDEGEDEGSDDPRVVARSDGPPRPAGK